MEDPLENPYVAVVSRKCRNLKKKLEKIIKVDTQSKSGKALDKDQLELLSSRSAIERALADVEAIKAQLEEVVAKEQLIVKQKSEVSTTQEYQSPAAPTITQDMQTETVKIIDINTETTSVYTQSESLLFVDASNQTLAVEIPQPAKPTSHLNVAMEPEMISQQLQDQLLRLLKALHVFSRYTAQTGRQLPPDIEYFGMSLLGKTSIAGFHETLQGSLRNTLYYLDPRVAPFNEAIRGMSYAQVQAVIDQLAMEMDPSLVPIIPATPMPTPVHPRMQVGGLVSSVGAAQPVPYIPNISFFPDVVAMAADPSSPFIHQLPQQQQQQAPHQANLVEVGDRNKISSLDAVVEEFIQTSSSLAAGGSSKDVLEGEVDGRDLQPPASHNKNKKFRKDKRAAASSASTAVLRNNDGGETEEGQHDSQLQVEEKSLVVEDSAPQDSSIPIRGTSGPERRRGGGGRGGSYQDRRGGERSGRGGMRYHTNPMYAKNRDKSFENESDPQVVHGEPIVPDTHPSSALPVSNEIGGVQSSSGTVVESSGRVHHQRPHQTRKESGPVSGPSGHSSSGFDAGTSAGIQKEDINNSTSENRAHSYNQDRQDHPPRGGRGYRGGKTSSSPYGPIHEKQPVTIGTAEGVNVTAEERPGNDVRVDGAGDRRPPFKKYENRPREDRRDDRPPRSSFRSRSAEDTKHSDGAATETKTKPLLEVENSNPVTTTIHKPEENSSLQPTTETTKRYHENSRGGSGGYQGRGGGGGGGRGGRGERGRFHDRSGAVEGGSFEGRPRYARDAGREEREGNPETSQLEHQQQSTQAQPNGHSKFQSNPVHAVSNPDEKNQNGGLIQSRPPPQKSFPSRSGGNHQPNRQPPPTNREAPVRNDQSDSATRPSVDQQTGAPPRQQQQQQSTQSRPIDKGSRPPPRPSGAGRGRPPVESNGPKTPGS